MAKDYRTKIINHLKEDIETFHHEASQDEKLIKALKKPASKKKKKK